MTASRSKNTIRNVALAGSIMVASVLGANPAAANDEPLLVTYGKLAPTAEGDHDHRQVIYISIDEDRTQPVYIRIFDPDTSGAFDTPLGAWDDSTTEFAIYGGEGAYSVPASFDTAEAPGGEVLVREAFGARRALDGTWVLLAALDPADGDLVHDRRIFRLVVDGIRGDDGNVYDVAASTRADANRKPADVEMFSFLPTVRVPDDDLLTELRFIVPGQARDLTIHNFDASGAEVAFETPFRTVTLPSSDQDTWVGADVPLRAGDRGRLAAITVRRGDEIPNDVTLYAADSNGQLLPIELPAHRWPQNRRPSAEVSLNPLSCSDMEFHVSSARDADGDALSFLWYMHDDAILAGRDIAYHFEEPGSFQVRLEVFDNSGLVASGWEKDFTIAIKAPPVAMITAPEIVALGVPVWIEGFGSTSASHDITNYDWHLSDGRFASGPFVNHAFREHGRHTIELSVVDTPDHPCNAHAVETSIWVNARPMALAGRDRHVSTGEAVSFNAADSRDPEDGFLLYTWNFGDGTTANGEQVEHSYAAPGEFQVTLSAEDASGVENSVGIDVARVLVNAPPVAVAGDSQTARVGTVVTFDASASSDPDGEINGYAWDFGDGATGSGSIARHTYRAVGDYTVSLVVTDSSGRQNNTARAQTSVEIIDDTNVSPNADAGDDFLVLAGRIARFDASSSRDADGNIIEYQWDFGDGAQASGVQAVYTYLEPGNYPVRLRVRDDSGKENGSDEDVVTVHVHNATNVQPSAVAGDDLTAQVGEIITFDASRSTDPDGNVVTYTWDFGDGARTSGISPSYAYFIAGVYEVTLEIIDDHPLMGTASDSVTVTVVDVEGER